MKMVGQSGEKCQYLLHPNEAEILRDLLTRFPFTGLPPAQISKISDDSQTEEREKLLAEALADHRSDLKTAAADLLLADSWKKKKEGVVLTLSIEAREMLLQILNDIRVGAWRTLGEPGDLDHAASSPKQLAFCNLMELAGYFEMSLLEAADWPI